MVNVAVVYQDLMAKVNLIISCIEDGVWESLLWRHEVQRGQPLGLWLTQERQEGAHHHHHSGGMTCSKTGGRFGQALTAQVWDAVCSMEMAEDEHELLLCR